MALLTAQGLAVIEATLCLYRIGVWTADLVVDAPSPGEQALLSGAITLAVNDGALEFKGTAVPGRSGEFLDAGHLLVVGGGGGLQRLTTAKHYQQATVRIVLGDLLRAAGETLAAATDAAVLATQLDRWTTLGRRTIGAALSSLVGTAAAGTAWRVLPDGTVWLGQETWPDAGIDYDILNRSPREALLEIGVEAPLLVPGTTLDGKRVSYVEHRVAGGHVRTTVYLEQ